MAKIKLLQDAIHTLTQGPRKIETSNLKAGDEIELPRHVNGFRDQIVSRAEENDRILSEYGVRPDGSAATGEEVIAASKRVAAGDYGRVYETA